MNMTHEELAWIAVSSVKGLLPRVFRKLMRLFDSPEDLLREYPSRREEKELQDLLSAEVQDKLLTACRPGYPERLQKRLEELDIQAVTQISPAYPHRFSDMQDAPAVLYARGNLSLLNSQRTIGIIGTRTPTRYGEKATAQVAKGIIDYGAVVVSGMARGLDSVSQKAALEAGGKTIAVLGSGVDVVYPRENQSLYDAIRENGLIISEYLPGAPPTAKQFPARNRLIAHLSDVLAVTEAGEKSGTNITVDYALQHNITVYAVPGNIDSFRSVSTNRLIRDGASPLLSVDDLAQDMNWDLVRNSRDVEDEEPIAFSPQEAQLVMILKRGPHTFDELSDLTGISTPILASVLGSMLMKGLAIQLPGRVYQLP